VAIADIDAVAPATSTAHRDHATRDFFIAFMFALLSRIVWKNNDVECILGHNLTMPQLSNFYACIAEKRCQKLCTTMNFQQKQLHRRSIAASDPNAVLGIQPFLAVLHQSREARTK
jgi:hypothetical protein